MKGIYDFNAQYIYDEIVETQREIQNTKDAYDLEIQACKEQNSILIQEIFNNQIKLKKCFSLQYEYMQFPRFDKNKIDWAFFTALREAETLHDAKCENWEQFLKNFGAYCRQCTTENYFSVVDLLTYSTIPSLFGFFSDLETSDDLIFAKNKKSTPNFIMFTDFALEHFFNYQVIQKGFIKDSIINVPLPTRLETLSKFTRSVFVWPPFLYFVHTVFAPIIKKIRSYYSSILTVEKANDNDLLVNTTDCLISNLLRELKDNIDQCPSEISYFLKSIQISVNSKNTNNENDGSEDIGLKCASDIFYNNFLSLIFTEPRRFFITDAHNDDFLFKTDSKFEEKLKKSSILFVKELISPINEMKKVEQTMPKYILIDVFDQKILEFLDEPKESKRNKKTKNFNETLIPNMQIKQYHLFKIKLTKAESANNPSQEKKEKNDDDDYDYDDFNKFDDDDDDDLSDDKNRNGYNNNIDLLDYSFNACLANNDKMIEFQLAQSLYKLIAYAPPLPNKTFELEKEEEENKENLFINVIQKVLVSEVHSLKNESKRSILFSELKEKRNLFPKNQKKLDSLFKTVKLRANPNSRLLPSQIMGGEQDNLSINQINVKLLNKRMNMRKERRQINAVLVQESRTLYINLFRKFLLINNNTNLTINEAKSEFVKNSQLFKNYFTNEKCFPIDSPTCIELATNPKESQKCFSLILKFHEIFKQNIGDYHGAEEVAHNSFFRHLTYYSYLVAKPQLIDKDTALSARFAKSKAISQYHTKSEVESEEEKKDVNDNVEINNDGVAFYLPEKVIHNSELIEGPRSKVAAALSSDDVPLKKVILLERAFKEVIDAFILKRNEDVIEVIAYVIASLHATHFASCFEFVNDFIYHFDDDDHAKLEIFAGHAGFFDLLSKVSKRLQNDNPDILQPSNSSSEELSLFTRSLVIP